MSTLELNLIASISLIAMDSSEQTVLATETTETLEIETNKTETTDA